MFPGCKPVFHFAVSAIPTSAPNLICDFCDFLVLRCPQASTAKYWVACQEGGCILIRNHPRSHEGGAEANEPYNTLKVRTEISSKDWFMMSDSISEVSELIEILKDPVSQAHDGRSLRVAREYPK